MRPEVFLTILVLGVLSYACRFGGFFLMRYVTVTPRVEAWLRSIPIALTGAVVGPIVVNGNVAEWVGLTTAIVLMRVTGNEFVSAIGAVTGVALTRAFLP
jgi:uncharacterized membrane protein